MYDLFINTLNFHAGKEIDKLPGLLVSTPPRRAARGREGDTLILLLTLTGSAPLTNESISDLLQQLANRYYATPGTVTAGMRSVTEALNNFILNRNLRNAREGWQAIAMLNIAVVRRDLAYIGHAGPTHTFLLTQGDAEEFFDNDAGRGLGTSRSFNLRFFQAELKAGDEILLCAAPPLSWIPPSLFGSSQLSLDGLRRRLLNQAGTDLQAVLVQVQAGKGQAGVRPWPAINDAAHIPQTSTKPTTAPLTPRPTSAIEPDRPAVPEKAPESTRPPESTPATLERPVAPPPPVREENSAVTLGGHTPSLQRPRPSMAVPPPPQAPAHSSPTNRKTSAPVTSTRRSSSRSGSDTLRSGLAPVWLAFNQFSQRLSGGLRTITGRMLPGSDNQVPTLSTGSMWFIAIIVPLMVVAIATTIYVRSGGSQQQAQYLTSAQQAIIQAQAQTDPALQRSAWMQAKYWLDKAEEYGQNSDTRAARSQVENALDLLDNISRLDLQPVMTDKFPDSVNITRVGINGTDVYVLDSNKGSILRLTRTNQGYTPDSTFICNSGPIGGTVIAPLIEMVILPADNKLKATVMGIDPSGKLLYCGPNVPPTAVNLPTPASGWGKIVAAKLDNDVLYVLDPKNNAVWRYEGNNGSFDQMPSLFFDQQVPKQLTTVIDLATAQDELYLLHNTGEMVHCTYSHIKEVKLTECEDPAMFSDRRQNTATQQRTFAEATFTQTLTSPGNNTLLVLDNKNKSIYRFSLKLNLDKVMTLRMSDGSTLTSKDISAIGVGPGNLLIVAIGQEIYSSSLP